MSSPEPQNPFEAFGGEEGVHRLVVRFYELMDTLPEAAGIRAMHKGDLAPMVDKLTTYLVGWMGGPRRYSERFGSVIIPAVHQPFPIGPNERDAWLLCFRKALDEQPIDAKWKEAIMKPMFQMADMCRTKDD